MCSKFLNRKPNRQKCEKRDQSDQLATLYFQNPFREKPLKAVPTSSWFWRPSTLQKSYPPRRCETLMRPGLFPGTSSRPCMFVSLAHIRRDLTPQCNLQARAGCAAVKAYVQKQRKTETPAGQCCVIDQFDLPGKNTR